ncbi:MAG: hypothetical protein HY722_08905 [Planctomycetes bacterium]|nr:hypothetical protein [Planctomycetota bacterium]
MRSLALAAALALALGAEACRTPPPGDSVAASGSVSTELDSGLGAAPSAGPPGDAVPGWPGFTEAVIDEGDGRLTRFYRIRHIELKDLLPLVDHWKGPTGRILPHEDLNLLIITDTPEHLERIRDTLKEVDRLTQQVKIAIQVVEVRRSKLQEVGLDFEQLTRGSKGLSLDALRGTLNTPGNILGGTTPSRGGEVQWGFDSSQFNWRLKLRALVEHGYAEILANPEVVVQAGNEAQILSVTDQPIPKSTTAPNGITTAIEFREVGIKLRVKPLVIGTDSVVLNVQPVVSAISGFTIPKAANEVTSPIITRREAQTTVDIKDGETLIIGGLLDKRTVRRELGVPLLRSIPLVGHLFQAKQSEEEKTEIVVSLTVHVIDPRQARPSVWVPADAMEEDP